MASAAGAVAATDRDVIRSRRERRNAAELAARDDPRSHIGKERSDRGNDGSRSSSALLAAALALPGMLPTAVHGQSVHDRGWVELKYLDYRDWQSGANRMGVKSPSFYALVPVSDTVEVEGSVV